MSALCTTASSSSNDYHDEEDQQEESEPLRVLVLGHDDRGNQTPPTYDLTNMLVGYFALMAFATVFLVGVSSILQGQSSTSSSIVQHDNEKMLPDPLRKLWCFDRNMVDNSRIGNMNYPQYTKGIAWVSDKYKILYLQNPKSGSSSITGVFRHMNGTFVSKSQLWKSMIENRERYRDYFTFTFVREPISRFSSGYYTILDRLGQDLSGNDLCEATGFQDMATWKTQPKDTPESFQSVIDRLTKEDVDCWTTHHTFPQTFFTSDIAGLPYHLDFVGHLESIEEDWDQMRKLIPHVPLLPMIHRNQAEGRPHHDSNKLHDWLLKNETAVPTLRTLCQYLMGDFLCYDYHFPEPCKDLMQSKNNVVVGYRGPKELGAILSEPRLTLGEL